MRWPLIGPQTDLFSLIVEVFDHLKKKLLASEPLENEYVWSHIGIKNLYTGYRFIGQSNIILSEIHFKFAILRTKITFKPPILYYIISSKDRYHLPEGDNVEQTIARLFWNLTIGISGLVVPTIFILRICLH
ncbi:hypothetical protein V1478_005043 [Vespula squamosa]|uniref:Uncharacterized protein n=1 Tax=Vespula squamosa TaxID=30214 RepID=A0ABD2BEM0_VESSQ